MATRKGKKSAGTFDRDRTTDREGQVGSKDEQESNRWMNRSGGSEMEELEVRTERRRKPFESSRGSRFGFALTTTSLRRRQK